MRKISILLVAVFLISGCTMLVRKPADMKKMAKGDGFVLKEKVEHAVKEEYIFQSSNQGVKIFVKTKTNDVEGISVITKDKKEKMEFYMNINDSDIYFVNLDNIRDENLSYYFEISDGKSKYYKGENWDTTKKKAGAFTFKLKKYFENVPSWVNAGVWYKIFVDRFRNGNIENDPLFNEAGAGKFIAPSGTLKSGTLKKSLVDENKWADEKSENYGEFQVSGFENSIYEMLKWEKKAREDIGWYLNHWRHYGGDIDGIKEKIDYISNAGYKVISLTPVFYSMSNHKNDSIDWRHIDPSFGVIEQNGKPVEGTGKYHSVKGRSEYKLLALNEENGINGLGEGLDGETPVWTESDIVASEFVKKAHEYGLKVVYDVDISCVGKEFYPFRDVIINGPESKYRKWFTFSEWDKTEKNNQENIDIWNPAIEYKGDSKYEVTIKDDKKYRRKWIKPLKNMAKDEFEDIVKWNIDNTDYHAWNKVKGVPLLKTDNSDVQKYILSAITKWVKGYKGDLSDGIDGYILLSAEKIDLEFIKKIKKAVKEINKEFYLGGELFIEPEKYLGIEMFDGMTNYRFMPQTLKFILNRESRNIIKASEYKNEEIRQDIRLSDSVMYGFINYADSQDTDRLFSMTINQDRDFDKNNKSTDKYKNIRPDLYSADAVNHLKIISAIQFLRKGTPAVFYGDEIGMWGGDDPDNRKPMMWEDIKGYKKEQDDLNKYRDFVTKFGKEVGVDEANAVIKYDPKENEEIGAWYKKLIELRNNESELIVKGKSEFLIADDTKEILIQEISSDKKGIIVIINNSTKNREKEPDNEIVIETKNIRNGSLVDIVSGDRYDIVDKKITLKVLKKSVVILLKK